MTFNKQDTLGRIVARFPKAADIFNEYKIDYCCGGNDSLETASMKANISIDQLLKELHDHFENLKQDIKDWNKAPFDQLINQILQAHHAYLHEFLPIISDSIKKIVRAHGHNHPELMSLYTQFQLLKTDMDMHLIKEETIQYPAIEKYLQTNDLNDLENALTIINELEKEHSDVGSILKTMRTLTNDYDLPNDACRTYEFTLNELQTLEANTFTHIHLENNILFPRLKRLSNPISLDTKIYELIKVHPEIKDIMFDLGFKDIIKPGMLNTVGRIMTLRKGCDLRKMAVNDVISTFELEGYTVL